MIKLLRINIHQSINMKDEMIYEIEIDVLYNGKDFHLRKGYPVDEMTTYFDLIWRDIGQVIKYRLTEEEESEKEHGDQFSDQRFNGADQR
jgi:hypothetical protein